MATFAPKIDANVAYEQPQAPVVDRTGEAIVGAATSLFSDLARTQRSQAQSGPDPLVRGFMDGMRKIESQRAAGQGTRASLNERVLVQNFVAAGGELDADLKAAVEASTGRPFEYLGQTEEQRQTQAMMESEEFQVAFQSARVTLGPDASEEEITQAAMSSVAEQSVAADTIARMRAGEKVNWELQGAAAFDGLISNFQKTSIGGLNMIVERGGMLTPDDVLGAKQQWDMLKASALSRPKGITDDQWVQIKDKIANMDNLFTTLTKASSSEQAMEQMQSVFVQSMGPASTMSFEELLTGLTAAKSPDVLITNAGINLADTMTALAGRSSLNVKADTESRLVETITNPTDKNQLAGNTILTELPAEYAQYKDISPEQHLADLKANKALMATITPADLGKEGAVDQFVDGMMGTGAVLLSSDKFLSNSFLKSVLGGNTKAVLDQIDQLSPEDATEARVMMRSGLTKQLGMLQAVEQSLASNLGVQYNGSNGRYYFTNDKSAIAAKASNPQAVIEDENGFYLDLAMVNRVGGPVGSKELADRRAAIGTVQGALNDYAMPASKDNAVVEGTREVELTDEGISSLTQYEPIKEAATMLGWSEQDQFFKLSDYMSKGGKGLDPRETAWCAAFVNSVLAKTGYDGTGSNLAQSFLDWGVNVDDSPKHGDIVVISRGKEPWMGHVGFFHGFDSNGDIQILGGNQGDAVTIKTYSKDRLLGFRRGESKGAAQSLPKASGDIGDGVEAVQAALAGVDLSENPGPEVMSDAPEQPQAPEGVNITDAVELAADQADLDRQARADEAAAETDVNRSERQAGASKVVNAEMINSMVSSMLSAKQKRQIKAAGYNVDDVEFFESQEEAEAALAAGEVERGTLYVDKLGNVFLLE